MGKVENFHQIVVNGKTPRLQEIRATALNLFELALAAVEPAECIRRQVRRQDRFVRFHNQKFDLATIEKVIVIGAGKAAAAMTAELVRILDGVNIEGAIAIPKSLPIVPLLPESFQVFRASHPLPDKMSQEAAKTIRSLLEHATPRDLVIAAFSGGASALLEMPASILTLEDIVKVNMLLLKSGATIAEVNTLRKHLSVIKGGNLARHCHHAPIVALLMSDVVGDAVDVIASGPTVPDASTFIDAINIVEKYRLAHLLPKAVRDHLEAGLQGRIPETPKAGDPCFAQVTTILVGSVGDAMAAISDYCRQAGWHCTEFSREFTGEARERGKCFIAGIPTQNLSSGCNVFLHAGELTVTIHGKGTGGRNQEMLLAMVPTIPRVPPMVVLSAGMDGIEGNSPAAGAIVDNKTITRARNLHLDPDAFLNQNDSFHFFDQIGDIIITGLTGTNVNDLTITIVWGEA